MTSDEWRKECLYIEKVATKNGKVKEMNYDQATFVRYCEVQRDTATREGHHDSATYIQHVIDDMLYTP